MKFEDRDERIMVTEDIFEEVLHVVENITIRDSASSYEPKIYTAIEKMIAVHLYTWD